MFVTQRQIAEEANVSRSTVAAVMSATQCGRISPEVRRRVREVAERLGYRPNRYARAMSSGRTGLVGIISFGTSLYVCQEKLQVATRRLIGEKYEVVVQDSGWLPMDESERGDALCQRMADARVEGVLLLYPNGDFKQRHLDALLGQKLPVVSIAGDFLKGAPTFLSDRAWAYETLTRHLLALGRRRFAVLAASSALVDVVERTVAGTGATLHVVSPRESYPSACEAKVPVEEFGYFLGMKGAGLALKESPDALICSNDEWAHGALAACREAGLRVPGDISVVGADHEPFGRYGTTPLTSIKHPSEAIAAEAVETLLRWMRTGARPDASAVTIRGSLVIRESCGAGGKLEKQG